MLTKPFKPLALAFLVNLIISVEDKIKYKVKSIKLNSIGASPFVISCMVLSRSANYKQNK